MSKLHAWVLCYQIQPRGMWFHHRVYRLRRLGRFDLAEHKEREKPCVNKWKWKLIKMVEAHPAITGRPE